MGLCSFLSVFIFRNTLATMVSAMAWNDNCNMLAAVADNRVTIWYYPNVAFVDPDIVNKTLLQLDQK